MEALFRSIVRLYPANVRESLGEEIVDVFREGCANCAGRSAIFRFRFYSREFWGILGGVVREHVRDLLPSFDNLVPIGRCFMRSGMKFPITGVIFMLLSFVGVVYAMFEAESVSTSYTGVPVGIPGGIFVLMGIGYLVGIAGWVVAFSLRRSGAERLSQTETWTAAK